jgi:hypothetical protein
MDEFNSECSVRAAKREYRFIRRIVGPAHRRGHCDP